MTITYHGRTYVVDTETELRHLLLWLQRYAA